VIGPRLKDLGRWFSGGTPPSERAEYWDGDVPWLSGKDFDKTVLREPTKFTTEEGAALHSRLMPGGRSVLLLVRGMALAHGLPVARLPFDAAINQDVRGLVLRPEFDPAFVYYALVGRRAELNVHIDRAAHGTARLLETVYLHRIAWMPQLTAQRTIAAFLERECERISAAASRESELTSRLSRVPAEFLEADHRVRAAERVRLRFSLRAVEQGWSPQCEARLAERGGWGVTKAGAANYGHFRPDEHKALPIDLGPLPEFELREGDVVMSRANTRELAGSAARVRATSSTGSACATRFSIPTLRSWPSTRERHDGRSRRRRAERAHRCRTSARTSSAACVFRGPRSLTSVPSSPESTPLRVMSLGR
jgi:type I restriction enzyme S subunit